MKKLMILMATTLFLAGCGPSDEPAPSAEPEQAPDAAQAETRREVRSSREQEATPLPVPPEGDITRNIPRIEGQSEVEGHGLTMLVDGSSPEAFRDSLQIIASDTTAQQYQRLDSALRYLRTYSPEAWQGTPNLYRSLDGMSGEEIIELAEEMRNERGRRR